MSRLPSLAGAAGYVRDFAAVTLPFAVYAALVVLGQAELGLDRTAAAEVFFLAQLAAAVLVAVTYLSPPVAAWTGLGVVVVAWSIGMGTVRGTVTVVVLTLGLAMATRRHAFLHPRARPLRLVAISIAVQVLMCNDVLMTADLWHGIWILLALPILAASCLLILGRGFGNLGATLTGLSLLTLGPGWTLASVLTLVVLASATTLATLEPRRSPRRAVISILLGSTSVLVLAAMESRLAALALAGGLVVLASGNGPWRSREVRGLAAATVFNISAALLAAVVAWTTPGLGGSAFLHAALVGALLLPAWAAQAAGCRSRPGLIHTGLGALLIAAGAGSGPAALTAGMALSALAFRGTGVAARLQGGWSGGLLALAVLLRAYPWLRTAPIETFLDTVSSASKAAGVPSLGADGPIIALLSLMLMATLIVVLGRLLGDGLGAGWKRAAPVALWGLVALGLLAKPSATGTVLLARPTLLTVDRSGWAQRLVPALPASEVVIETNLIQSLALPAGTILGNVRLLDAEQQPLAVWRLELGRDTAEWAALRPDIAARPGFQAPPAWSVAAAPTGRHFAARFRNRWTLPTPGEATWITVRRNPSLPEDLRLAIYRLEIRP